MPAANLQTICSSGALLQPCVALFTCPQPFVHARSKCQSWVCVPVLAVLPGLTGCVCVPVLASVHGLGVCVCVCASPGCVCQSWLFFQDWVCVCVCQSWLFFQDWVCVPGCSSRTGVCVCASPGFHPLGVCATQTSSGTFLRPYIAPFACPQPFVHARRPFAALAPFSCSQLFISLFMVAQPFNSQGFDNHFCSLIASIFRCNPDSRHV